MTVSSPTRKTTSSGPSSGAASQQPWRMASGALSPPMTSTAARKHALLRRGQRGSRRLGLFLVHLKRQLRVDVPAVVAGAVRELAGAALGTADVVDRLQRVVRAALALARLAGLLNGKHVTDSCAALGQAHSQGPGAGVLAAAGAASSAGVGRKYE